MLVSIAEAFKLKYDPNMVRKRVYVSELNVQTDRLIAGLNRKLEGFAAKLNSLFANEPGVRFEASAIAFWPDPTLQAIRPTGFTFERKINTAYSERKYYSQAPVDTDTHLSLLNELEELLVA